MGYAVISQVVRHYKKTDMSTQVSLTLLTTTFILYCIHNTHTVSAQVSTSDTAENFLNDLLYSDYNIDSNNEKRTEYLPTSKRYASLSYYYTQPRSRSGRRRRPRYYRNRYYKSKYHENYYKPWLNLPDGQCAQQRCETNNDCCRQYSKCDKSARVCYSCWYSHPCKTSRDCCERYPYCNKHRGGICQA